MCIDVDECLDGTPCDLESSLCINKDGEFKCKCLDGFKEKKDGTCADINECKGKTTCGPRADFIDLPGTFECQCLAGLVMNGKKCDDINECTTGSHNCNKNASCTNAFLSLT